MIHRRRFLSFCAGAAGATFLPPAVAAQGFARFDLARLKDGYRRRIAAIRKMGDLPILDIESSYNPLTIDLPDFVKAMDRSGVAQMALSVDQPGKLVNEVERTARWRARMGRVSSWVKPSETNTATSRMAATASVRLRFVAARAAFIPVSLSPTRA